MFSVILTTSMSGLSGSFTPGDTYKVSTKAEAQRMVDAGLAKFSKEDTTTTTNPSNTTKK